MSSRSRKFKASSLRRPKPTRAVNPRVIIAFEDSKSAPYYFEGLRSKLGIAKTTILVDRDRSGTDPLSVVNRAIAIRSDLGKSFSKKDGDQVWAVVDVDRHTTMNEAKQLAKSHDVCMAISNPCFEYWILLHFEDSQRHVNSCDELIRKHLSSHVRDYRKGVTRFDDVLDKAQVACERAERGYQRKMVDDPTQACPCTQVYDLVAIILSISK